MMVDDTSMFFDSWFGIGRVLVVGTLAYVSLIALLRVSGNRTLSKMNAFDLIVTVALGSTLATVLLSNQVALVEGLVALALLVGLQAGITWLSVRSKAVADFVKSEPVLIVHRGEMLRDAMRRQRVNEAEVLQAARGQGIGSIERIDAMILETDGSFSVVCERHGPPSAFANVSQGVTEGRSAEDQA